MRRLAPALLMAMALGREAAADERYDRRLDEAAAGIVAARIDGPLRGAFDPGEEARLSVHPDKDARSQPQRRQPGVWQDGLAIAVERRSTVSPGL